MKPVAYIYRFLTRAGVYLLAALLLVLATQAKLSQYYPDGPTGHLAKATKMKECRMEEAPAVRNMEAAPFDPDWRASGPPVAAKETPRPKPFCILLPFYFRPPPAVS